MSNDIIPGPDFVALNEPSGFGLSGIIIQSAPLTEPGGIADASGDLWLNVLGDRLTHGEMAVTLEQARTAAPHGWMAVPGSEHDEKVNVRRPDPNPSQR